MATKNILFPLETLLKIVDLLSYLDLSSYDCSLQGDCDDVLNTIIKKLQAVELRKAYSRIFFANDEDSRFFARMEYLKQRHEAQC
jgi:hypothetical protein